MQHNIVSITFSIILLGSISCTAGTQASNISRSPMEIQSLEGHISINGETVNQPKHTFKSGLIEAHGESGVVTVSYLDGDTLSLKNGKANVDFAEADSVMAMMGNNRPPELNLNLRLITLESGVINFQLHPRKELSKVSYRLFYNGKEIHFKDADLSLIHKNGGLLTVSRGNATIVNQNPTTGGQPSKVEAGTTININTVE